MDTQSYIEDKAEDQGWTQTTMLGLLCEYIDSLNSPADFQDFIDKHVDWENEQCQTIE